MQKIVILSFVTSALLAENIKLDDIVVSATKVSQTIEDTTASAQVITKEEIRQRGYISVVDAINSFAGVGFTQEGGMGGLTKVYIRGVGGGRVLVLVDGIRFQDPSSKYGADFSRLMLSNVERIELISGAQSGVWGADASAGVINIITTKAHDKGFHNGINLQYGSYNTQEIGAYSSYKDEKYSAKLSVNQYKTDGYSSQSPYGSDIDDYEDDNYKNRTIDISLGYNFTKNDKISVQAIDILTKNNNDTYSVGNGTENVDMEVRTKTHLYNVTYNKKIQNNQINLRYNRAEFKKDELDAKKGIKNYEGTTDEVELHDTIQYGEKNYVLVGASYKGDNIEITKVDKNHSKHDIDSNALFITNNNFIDKLIITESLRRDDYSNFGDEITGKLGLKYNITKESSIKANYGTGYNAPSLLMILNPNGKPNDNLEAENTKSFDITGEYKGASLTYFYNTVDNLISYDKKEQQHINIDGTSTFKGIEAKYSSAVGNDFYYDLSYTYLLAKDKNGIDLRRRVKDTYKISMDYYFNEKVNLNFNGEYIGRRYDDMLSIKDPTKTKGRQTGEYFVGNIVTNYEFNNNSNIYLKVNNIFDRYYQVVDGYSTSPRAFYIGLNTNF
ncbi:MAG: TonB-dependent receptor [Epsilonproteobacteria bacterium]|nr:TonB-dependent receptor [Campylobacterota bacterium]